MYKTITLLGLAICFQGFGQKEVVSAYNANKEGDFATAASYIEQAILNPKANVKNKTWRYRGEIYLNISNDSTLFVAFPKALDFALESFQKALILDKKGSYKSEVMSSLNRLNVSCNSRGIEAYENNDYTGAGQKFLLAYEVGKAMALVDTNALSNAGLSYKLGLDVVNAENIFRELIELGYQPVNQYLQISTLHREAGDVETSVSKLDEAISAFPKAQELYIEKFNTLGDLKKPVIDRIQDIGTEIDSLVIDLKIRDDNDPRLVQLRNERDSLRSVEVAISDRSKASILAVVEADPENAGAWLACGSTLLDLGLIQEGLQAYDKVIELDPSNQDAWFSIGYHWYNEAIEQNKQLGEFPLRLTKSEQARYDELVAASKAGFEKTKECWLKAYELNNEDCNVIKGMFNVNIYLKDVEGQAQWQQLKDECD